jgi:hypothetical protein
MSSPPTSHKRTSSTASNTTEAPATKRQEVTSQSVPSQPPAVPSHIYVVMYDILKTYGDLDSIESTIAAYANLEDANIRVARLRDERQSDGDSFDNYEASIDKNGCLDWQVPQNACGDGEDGVWVHINILKVLPRGSEKPMDWSKALETPPESEDENDLEEEDGNE